MRITKYGEKNIFARGLIMARNMLLEAPPLR